MTADKFNELVKELREASFDTLLAKNANYSAGEDKLHNFHAGADVMGATPAQTAWGYATKHLVALRDKVQRNDFHDREDFLEKCQDVINYICLIWCIGNEEAEKYTREGGEVRPATKTYRDMVEEIAPDAVDASCGGGVKGCPCDYFRGAPIPGRVCTPNDCYRCWSRPYQGEEVLHDHP